MGKWRFALYALFFVFPWVSQLMFPGESIWEPIWWNIGTVVVIFVIEKWAKP